ncbi:GNAT family N-acetyltransferase [Martelella lutilitoris]|uniref:GNAT family N-acetyltransferase n=1 Tax=Martelella lutilitoris TaxID=2583532 RepID=A0A5C4JP87_9HYPH|nr:GNAT family N-acetyltransferase [Martelella lutilitoris]TNB47158.1 GNAT family N-acetyltransferase [Martelella lutilitoris]
MSSLTVDIARMDALTAGELYDVLKLRVDVFVVEQNCPYPELDGKDADALHLRLLEDGKPVAYGRIFAPGTDKKARIGRIVVAPSHRGQKLGERLMSEAIAACERLAPDASIAISAQAHLERFYAGFGFETVSKEYLEDGIPHIDMVRDSARIQGKAAG